MGSFYKTLEIEKISLVLFDRAEVHITKEGLRDFVN